MSSETIRKRYDSNSEQGGKWSDYGYDLKAEPTGFTDGLDSGYGRR